MTLSPHHGPKPAGSILGETLVGTSLVLLGASLVYMAFTTPIVIALAVGRSNDAGPAVIVLAWAAMLAAPLGLVLLGTDRLTRLIGAMRAGIWRRPPAYVESLADDIAVVTGVILDDGRPAPMLLVGSFGTAVIHEGLGVRPPDRARRTDDSPERDPREATVRDADRVRHWLGQHEVDFVVRVYAAILTTDRTLGRTGACAVVPPEQLGAWVASLPRQRSLTADRRTRIVGLLGDAT